MVSQELARCISRKVNSELIGDRPFTFLSFYRASCRDCAAGICRNPAASATPYLHVGRLPHIHKLLAVSTIGVGGIWAVILCLIDAWFVSGCRDYWLPVLRRTRQLYGLAVTLPRRCGHDPEGEWSCGMLLLGCIGAALSLVGNSLAVLRGALFHYVGGSSARVKKARRNQGRKDKRRAERKA